MHYNEKMSEIKNINEIWNIKTFGQKTSDGLTKIIGSWALIITQTVILIIWLALNLMGYVSFDPYPFILMNLFLSMQAAYTGPVVMMSQNREEHRDRIKAKHAYELNLKMEKEIQSLHKKLDLLLNENSKK